MRAGFVEPMKAAVTAPPPHDGRWLYEVKFDGFRALAVKRGKTVHLWSRNRKPLEERFPEVAAAVARLPVRECILDGEVCALDAKGASSFQILQNQAESGAPLVYYVFDVLMAEGKDLRALLLLERKERLAAILARARDPVRPSAFFAEDPARVLETLRKLGGEGAIAKRKDSRYEAGRRSRAWVKIKFVREQEFVVVGYSLPRKSRKHFGALLLGCRDVRGKLVYVCKVGTGFNGKSLALLHKKLLALEVPAPRFEGFREPGGRWRPPGWKPSENRWVKPKLVVQVRFTEWTDDGALRHPSYIGLREDKGARGVIREPAPPPSRERPSPQAAVERRPRGKASSRRHS
ncbi:MAG: non-homologous end-joining DNA ligase [Verrucomicrobium sp.]|nr:non-homologous end-joining DNA ligase [Verrucomicrobium sp.]